MKKLSRKAITVLTILAVWLIMNETVSVLHVVFGVIIGVLAIYFSSRLLDIDFSNTFYISPFKIIKYSVFMIYSVYVCGIKATYYILKGDVKPNIVKCNINEQIQNKFLQNIIGASITLTPGTITLNNENGKLTVLCIHKQDGVRPCESFEPYILSMQKDKEN